MDGCEPVLVCVYDTTLYFTVMASSILAEQEEQRKHNQAQVSKDLSKLKGDIKDVWARVGELNHHLAVFYNAVCFSLLIR